MPTFVNVFIIVTAVAVVIQAGILIGLFFAVRKTSKRVESLATDVQTKALPTIETAQSENVVFFTIRYTETRKGE